MEAWRYELYYRNSLMHHGRPGQRWGQRNGPPYPLDKKQLSAEEKKKAGMSSGDSEKSTKKYKKAELQKGKNTYTRFSDTDEKEVRKGTYVSSTKSDYKMYMEDAKLGGLGNDSHKDIYEMTIKSHGKVKVADVNVTLNNIMDTIEKRKVLHVFRSADDLKALQTYKKLKDVGYFDSKKPVDERYDLMLKALTPKNKEELREFYKGKYRDEEAYANTKKMHLAGKIHKEVYKDRDEFSNKYRSMGYDAVVDPEDWTFTYENPYIITNPDKFKVVSSKNITNKKKKKG